MTDRAVSEVLGFVFAFALVTATVASVYTLGIGGLQDAQRAEQVNNAERAFDVLADNMRDVHRKGAPSRATEISLGGAAVSIGEPITVTVEAENASEPADNVTVRMRPRPIVYSGVADSTIVYVAGAVIRTDGNASVMRSGPGVVASERAVVVPFVHTYPASETRSRAGESTVQVVGRLQRSDVAGQFQAGPGHDVNVTVTVESPRAEVWGHYFEQQGFEAVPSPTAGEVAYRYETDRVYVPRTRIDVELRG